MNLPDEGVLTHKGVTVAVWFQIDTTNGEPNKIAVVMPMFGGYYASSKELGIYRRAAGVVKRRLKKLGHVVDG